MDLRIKKLLVWYDKNKRILPWRTTRNAYRIFISELMLQQTQVDRVIPKYRDWLKCFPAWTSLANAKTAELIHAWAGLGYNRRALYAREAAKDVMLQGIPSGENEWRRLKGVGPYMAAALAEFVDHQRAIVMDTNVRRVAGRVFLGIPFPRATDDTRILRVLEKMTPRSGAHWDLPQASMDLASAICLPRVPTCDVCPLRESCLVRKRFSSGQIERTLSKKRTSKPVEPRHAEKKYPDRIYRGRMLAWIREQGRARIGSLGRRIDETYDPIADEVWLRAMAARLVTDGLLAYGTNDTISLPHS